MEKADYSSKYGRCIVTLEKKRKENFIKIKNKILNIWKKIKFAILLIKILIKKKYNPTQLLEY